MRWLERGTSAQQRVSHQLRYSSTNALLGAPSSTALAPTMSIDRETAEPGSGQDLRPVVLRNPCNSFRTQWLEVYLILDSNGTPCVSAYTFQPGKTHSNCGRPYWYLSSKAQGQSGRA